MNWLQWQIAKWCGLVAIIQNQQAQIENLKKILQYERAKNYGN